MVRSVECIRRICKTADIIALKETWLLPHDVLYLGSIDNEFGFVGNSAVDTSDILRGRPYGGVAILWWKSLFPTVTVLTWSSVRLVSVKVELTDRTIIVFSVYMPTDSTDNLIEFTECLCEINAIIQSNNVEAVFIVGDLNAHPGELFDTELKHFCAELLWLCIDRELLPSDTYTFVSYVHGMRRWFDHCVMTSAARRAVVGASVLYDIDWSDHYPIQFECDLGLIKPKSVLPKTDMSSQVTWGESINKLVNTIGYVM